MLNRFQLRSTFPYFYSGGCSSLQLQNVWSWPVYTISCGLRKFATVIFEDLVARLLA